MKNKMTTKDLKDYIISEAKKLHKIEVLKEEKKRIDKELKMLSEANQYDDEFDDFEADGFYTVSNAGGYEIMISDDGEKAKVRDAFGSEHSKTSGWLRIEYDADEDANRIIDPNGYDIPLNMVMRIRK